MKPDVERQQYEGLCMTCNHAGSCIDSSRSERSVWRCENFDDSVPFEYGATAVVATEALTRGGSSPRSVRAVDPVGLCSNCDNLPACCLPKAESGVWHCEQYL